MIPAINLRRALLIARRDYFGYIKTWGFWISFCLPIIGGVLGAGLAALDLDFDPVRYETILDETGQHKDDMIAYHTSKVERRQYSAIQTLASVMLPDEKQAELHSVYEAKGLAAAKAHLDEFYPGASRQLKATEQKTFFVNAPADTLEGLKPYLSGTKTMTYNGQEVALNGALIIKNKESIETEYWSAQINAQTVKFLANDYFKARAETDYLESGGLSAEGFRAARLGAPHTSSFNPTKVVRDVTQGQAVTNADMVPYAVAAVMALLLWLSVFSGAYMLLTSMLEEKLNKLLEMMLATTRFSEIIFGKLIGVAALTLTAMLPYILIGIAAVIGIIMLAPPETSLALKEAFTPKLLIFFPIFLVLGYVFYGALFIAMGALANSMQDAQTITTPIVLILSLCVMVVPIGVKSPDSPILNFAAWFPLSAPFAAIMRLPSDPPLWELCLSAGFLAILAIGVVWLAGRIFRYGVLSGGSVKGASDWIKRKVFRRKA